MLYIKLFIEREKNIGQSAPECPFKDCKHPEIAYSGNTTNILLHLSQYHSVQNAEYLAAAKVATVLSKDDKQ